MKIILANPRGFCAGVNMAIDVVNQVLSIQGPPVYVFHEIVHNKHVVDDFKSRGDTFVNGIDEVPEGAVVVYSAHGISPEGRRQRRFPDVRYPAKDDICYATSNRQNAVTEWSPEADVVLVVGSQNSSNSKRLVERAEERGVPAHLIDDASELKPEWLAGKTCVLVT